MSEIHEFQCDKCGKRVVAHYNGEHYLPPKAWVQVLLDALEFIAKDKADFHKRDMHADIADEALKRWRGE